MLVEMGPLGKALYTPRYLLSLHGSKAKSDPYQDIQKVKNPILILRGKADKLVEPGIAERSGIIRTSMSPRFTPVCQSIGCSARQEQTRRSSR